MKKTAGIVISIGIVLALIGEMNPIMSTIFGIAASDQALQLETITNNLTSWRAANGMMVVGGLISALGLWVFAREVPIITDNKNIQTVSTLGAVSVVLGALIHIITRYEDLFLTPEEMFNNSTPDWMYPAYSIFTRLAIFIFGYILLQTGYSKKLGVAMIAITVLFMVLMGLHGPPGTYNFSFLVMGITLLFKRSSSPQGLPQTA